MCEVLSAIIGTIVGGLITFIVSNHYYKKSTSDLEKIGKDLYYNTRQVLLGLKYANLIDVEIEANADHTEQFTVNMKIPAP